LGPAFCFLIDRLLRRTLEAEGTFAGQIVLYVLLPSLPTVQVSDTTGDEEGCCCWLQKNKELVFGGSR